MVSMMYWVWYYVTWLCVVGWCSVVLYLVLMVTTLLGWCSGGIWLRSIGVECGSILYIEGSWCWVLCVGCCIALVW